MGTHPGFTTGTGLQGGCAGGCMFGIMSCLMGSQNADAACRANVAAAVLQPDDQTSLVQQGAFIGPLRTTNGPPSVIDLDSTDAKEWRIFSDAASILELGEIALKELKEKTGVEIVRVPPKDQEENFKARG